MKRSVQKLGASLLVFLSVAGGDTASAGNVVPEQEYGKKIKAAERLEPLTSSVFGDSVSLYNGAVGFTQVDIDLPGNNALPVRLARTLTIEQRNPQETIGGFADWELDVPYIDAVVDKNAGGWTVQGSNPGARCSSGLPPRTTTPYFRLDEIWHGTNMHIPGEGARELYVNDQPKMPAVSDGLSYPWVTRDFYRIRCASSTANGYPGESFIAVSPGGVKYFFNHGSQVYADTLGKGSEYPSERVERYHVYLRATRVEDRFGNYVNYNYTGNALTSIVASDGRTISITYSSGKVSQAAANGRVWAYAYRAPSSTAYEILQSVTVPDGSAWHYDWIGMPQPAYDAYPVYEEERPDCPETPSDGGTGLLTMTHPSGAVGQFTYGMTRHRRDGVSGSCVVRGVGYQTWTIQNYFDNYALLHKKISGGSFPAMEWGYDYETGAAGISQVMGSCLGCNTTKDVIVTKPGGVKEYYRYGVTFGVNEGRLLRVETKDALGNTVRVVSNSYVAESSIPSQPFSDAYGHSYLLADPLSNRIRPVSGTVVQQDGDAFTKTITAFDVFAREASVSAYSSVIGAKSESIEYQDDLAAWVIGQVKKRYAANSNVNNDSSASGPVLEEEVVYDAKSLPWKVYRFGKLQQTLTYNADGTLATAADGAGNTSTYSSWKRGIARSVLYPDAATLSATVDDNGWITSVTDENGYVTGYGYDAMGRMASIVQPTGDTLVGGATAYHSTWANYRALTDTDWKPAGIATGQWRKLEGTGDHIAVTYYDAMWRPVLSNEYDQNNVASTLRAVRTEYDTSGRKSFESYPASVTVPGATGIRTFYDALDRVTRVEQDSELGVLATTTEYLAGLKTRVTNPRNKQTTTSFMAWDQPGYDLPILSEQPEGKVIQIARHPQFGWPLSMTQRNAANTLSQTRRYVYDGNAQLCKTIEPETGATVTGYDAAGNPSWSAAGLDATTYGSTTDCQHAAANASGRVTTRTYDTRNRLSQLSFPDGRGNQIWTYTPDGKPASVTAYNGPGSTLPVVMAYTYNHRRLLTGESVSQTSSPAYTWTIGSAYDAYGNLASQTYPTGLTVDYAPNPLGQATKAGSYATGAQYYPNGALKQFTYGNGIVHSMTQNLRQLPSRVTSSGGVNDFGYTYDKGSNITAISD